MVRVYKYTQSFGRMGDLSGLFLATESDVAKAMGKTVYLGEVLGKHSDVTGQIDEKTLQVVSQDSVVIAFVKEQLGGGMGTNPIERWLEQERARLEEEREYGR